MKKFCAIAIASAVALSAAAERQLAVENFQAPVKSKVATMGIKGSPISRAMKAPRKAAATIEDFTACQYWLYEGLLNGQSGSNINQISITASGANEVQITFGQGLVVTGTVTADGKLEIPRQKIGQDSDGDIIFYIKEFDQDGDLMDGESSTIKKAVGEYADGVVTFPEYEVWALGDPTVEYAGWYILTYANQFAVEQPDPFEGLTSLGMGQFLDNIIYPMFENVENTTVADVEVLTDGEGMYVVKNPLKVWYALNGWGAYESPEMVLDATDPDNVMIEVTSTGIGDNENNLWTYFSMSYYCDQMGEQLDPDAIITKTVDGDTVTFTFPVESTIVWAYQYGQMYIGSPYVSTLTFTEGDGSKVEVVGAENNATEYYTLQGVRVANPQGMVIRVKDGKAVKTIIR